MEVVRNITQDTVWVGGGDVRLALFENMFPLENGVSYNSFLISDEKTALVDTVDESVGRRFIENIKASLNGRSLDYLIINHMEPDHCANIEEICRLFPKVQIVGNKKTFQMIQQFYDMDISGRTLEVKDGDSLSLGTHTLRFIFAPMVHWPEVMFTYDDYDKILFSADAFGTFGGYTGNLFSDEVDYEEVYFNEARRYYTNIVGKYGVQVQAALKKMSAMDIRMICPLHGPILRGDGMQRILDKYALWSSYQPEERGVLLTYASMYGNTENAVQLLANLLAQNGVKNIRVYDVSKTHFSTIVADAFRFSHLVFASPTYNLRLYSAMENVIGDLAALNFQNREVSVIGNGSWAPAAGKIMVNKLSEMKDMRFIGEALEIKSALKKDQYPEMENLAKAISASVLCADENRV
ncbi:MAG: FprA family A-type flavoprotein [Clostridiales bacterium]|nr:FprA family A-type flavoprotein [Clostridiales bacterium]